MPSTLSTSVPEFTQCPLLGRIVCTQVHKMRPFATTDVARSVVCVSVSVCWSHSCTVQKQLTRSRCR